MGDATSGPVRLSFNPQLRVEFRGATVTSDAGLLLPRELDERLGLDALIERHLTDPRTGHNRQFPLAASSVSRSTAGWPATRTPTTPSGWPRIRPFACWPRASGGKRASRSPRRSTGSRRRSSLRAELARTCSPQHGTDPARFDAIAQLECDSRYRQLREPGPRGTRADRRAPHSARAVLHPTAGGEPLDADSFSADCRAHRATRMASDVRTAQRLTRELDHRQEGCLQGWRSRVATLRDGLGQRRWRRKSGECDVSRKVERVGAASRGPSGSARGATHWSMSDIPA